MERARIMDFWNTSGWYESWKTMIWNLAGRMSLVWKGFFVEYVVESKGTKVILSCALIFMEGY